VPLWNAGVRSRGSYSRCRARAQGALLPAYAGVEGCQSSSYPKGKGTYTTESAAAPLILPVGIKKKSTHPVVLAFLWD
jgi:hypothetical protein